MTDSTPHSIQEMRERIRQGLHGAGPIYDTASLEAEIDSLFEQFEAVSRVAEAAKTYRDVRGDYTWVQMIQALDAWENPNPEE